MSARASAGLAAVVGLVVVAGVAAAVGLPQMDLVQVVGIAGGAALLTGVLGAAAVRLLRGRSFTAQVVVVALTSTAAVTAGALAGGGAMFFDTHDLQVLAVVVTVGAVVSVVAALLLGGRVGAASRSLGEVARRLGDVDGVDAGPAADREMPEALIAEFARLAGQLEATRGELEVSRARERATDRARRELVSWVSHDLRTPLSGILAVTELLEDGMAADAAEERRLHATIRREAEKLGALVDDLFEVSRIEAGAIALDPVPVDLQHLVDDTLAGLRAVAERRGIDLRTRLVGDRPHVLAGRPELTRVLGNLVANAVRESRDGGWVEVAGGRDDAGAWLAVTDTCGGIPEAVIDRVFEASYRGEAARTPRSDGGGGLGLAIARGFVHAHGGRIDVANVDGGCRFSVRIPDQVQGGPAPGSAPPPGSAATPGPGPA